jgi:hypothetical protein
VSEKIFEWDDITPEVLKEWAYDEDLIFMEQDEDLLLYDFELVPTLLELAGDKECPKGNYVFCILCQFSREQVTRGASHGGPEALKKVVESLLLQPEGMPKQWQEYTARLLSYFYAPKKDSKNEAHEKAHDLLIGVAGRVGDVLETNSTTSDVWRFTLKTSITEYIEVNVQTGAFKYFS